VSAIIGRKLANSKRRILRRLDKFDLRGLERPMLTARNIHYEVSTKTRALACGGIGAIQALVRRFGLAETIDRRLHLFKIHLPYHESDHVLNLAYLPLCGGTCLDDLEWLRNNEVYLDALAARRIPDPTTAGDFCRRFRAEHIDTLQDIIDEVRQRVWAQQGEEFFEQAIIDMDGTLTATTGACKEGMDIAYDGTWGYHPLLISLANTGEVLRLLNRSGNRPSHEGAAAAVDRAVATCVRGGFRQVLLRGDTDFSQTEHLDRWHEQEVQFIFGYDAAPNLVRIAEQLPDRVWRKLERPPAYQATDPPRARPGNVKDAVVRRRQFDTLRLQSEQVAEFNYQPTACRHTYRMVVVRKNISVEKGEQRLFDEIRYFFYITNAWVPEANEIVFSANDRCNQENLIAQLKGGVYALRAPVDNLESNWAYMVMTALAWNLKAWWALTLPETPGRWQERYRADKQWVLRLEFRSFLNAFMYIPCQIVQQARKIIYRVLAWNPKQTIFFRLLTALRH
jgi:Transposase DDE domain group 1